MVEASTPFDVYLNIHSLILALARVLECYANRAE